LRCLQAKLCRAAAAEAASVQHEAADHAQDGRAITSERGKRKRCMGACQRLPRLCAGTPGCVAAALNALQAWAATVRSECATPTFDIKIATAPAFEMMHNQRAHARPCELAPEATTAASRGRHGPVGRHRSCALARTSKCAVGATRPRTRAVDKRGYRGMPLVNRGAAQVGLAALTTIDLAARAPMATAQPRRRRRHGADVTAT